MRGMCCVLGFLVATTAAAAQQAALDVLVDAEAWETDAGSRLLARNEGRLAFLGRLHAWGTVRFAPAWELVAMGEVEGASGEEEVEVGIEELVLRYFPSRALHVEGGKLLTPLGGFAARGFSNLNPLIGKPDGYSDAYPWGVVAAGAAGPFDYRAGLVSLPGADPDYMPEAGHTLRPIVGAGWSAGPAFRVGMGVTHGPYLGPDVQDSLPVGAEWRDFRETIVALDARYSGGYAVLRGELAWAVYDVPTLVDPVHSMGGYVEALLTLTPRLFAAARLERYRYARVRPEGAPTWRGTETTQQNGEVGVGYRLGPGTVVKLSYRLDHWPDDPSDDGHALAVQLSQWVDVGGVFAGRR